MSEVILRSARSAVAKAFCFALRWGPEFWAIFPTLCLRRQSVKSLKESCRLFCCGDMASLFEAARLAVPPASSSSPSSGFVMEEDDISSPAGAYDDIPPSVRKRAEALCRMGYLSRASSTLNCAALAPPGPDTLEKLRALHPQGVPISPAELLPLKSAPFSSVTEKEVKQAIFGIGRGSVGGPTRLSRDHVAACLQDPAMGAMCLASFTKFVNSLVDMPLTSPLRSLFFGARLVALAKKDGGVRPVAIGDISRRTLAKVLVARHSSALGQLLLPTGQVGVGVSCGGEALTFAAKHFVTLALEASDQTLVKLDLRNAFNQVSRLALFDALSDLERRHPGFGDLLRYAHSAYGLASPLFFGADIVMSSEGCQQGDPLGPLFFSLTLAMATTTAVGYVESADLALPCLRGSYLDDMVIGGSNVEVSIYLTALKPALANIGLSINTSKCEVAGAPWAWDGPDMFSGMRHLDLDDWTLLGTPCGSCDAFLSNKVVQVKHKLQQFLALPAHLAFLLAKFCGPYPMTQFWLRTVGDAGRKHFDDVDAALLWFFGCLIGPFPDQLVPAITLPSSRGGLGLLRCGGRTASIAHCAAVATAAKIVPFLLNDWPVEWFGETIAEAASTAEFVLPDPLPATRLQHHLNAFAHEEESARFIADPSVSPEAIRQFKLGRGVLTAAAVLAPPFDLVQHHPLTSSQLFAAFVRFRLGLPLAPAPAPCLSNCGHQADEFGAHSLSCMAGGEKQGWHYLLLREIHRLCSLALWRPRLEVHPFPEAPGLRMDLLLPAGTYDASRQTLIDVSITNAMLSATPNSAAEAVARRKLAKYGPQIDALQLFLPLVFETTGGSSSAVGGFLQKLSKAVTCRLEVDGGARYVRQCISNSIASCISSRIVKQFTSGAGQDEAGCPGGALVDAPLSLVPSTLAPEVLNASPSSVSPSVSQSPDSSSLSSPSALRPSNPFRAMLPACDGSSAAAAILVDVESSCAIDSLSAVSSAREASSRASDSQGRGSSSAALPTSFDAPTAPGHRSSGSIPRTSGGAPQAVQESSVASGRRSFDSSETPRRSLKLEE